MNAWVYAVLQAAAGASSPIPQVRLWHLKWQSARQAARGERMRSLLGAVKRQAREHRRWLSEGGGAWGGISAACGQGKLGALAARLNMDAVASAPRDIILTGLSTVATYGMTWDMLLGSTAGATRRNFLAIRQMEDAVNRIAQAAFCRAAYYYRGMSLLELEGICSGKILPGLFYPFVSMSADPAIALRFALGNSYLASVPDIVLAIDSHKARLLGAIPAMYSISSDVLSLPFSYESASRTFGLQRANELQAHFHPQWPPGSSTMARSVITVLETSSGAGRLARDLGVPCIPYKDILPSA